jgi:hypothetical protein
MTERKTPRKILGNAIVIAFLAMQLFFGFRSLVLEDARLGWGMFGYQVNYTVSYEWVLRDGTTRKQPGRDLAGRTLKYLDDTRPHRTRYGRGAIRGWTRSYLEYLYEKYLPEDAVGVRAVVAYRINKLGDKRELVVQVPEEASRS